MASSDNNNASNVNALLAPLLSSNVNLSGSATFQWQDSGAEEATHAKFFFKSWELHELPGLCQQSRSSLFTNVEDVKLRVRKIPGINTTVRAFICANDDIDPGNFRESSLLDFIRHHPGAVPQYTLDKDTTQSSLDFAINWLPGLGNSVTYTMPPLRTPRLVLYIEVTEGSLGKAQVAWSWSGLVRVQGYGYVAGRVAGA